MVTGQKLPGTFDLPFGAVAAKILVAFALSKNRKTILWPCGPSQTLRPFLSFRGIPPCLSGGESGYYYLKPQV
jgi:hypothetical protein